jgi:phosphoenolpyruvate synthase/pyruvate phosphate dikinase
MKTFEPPFSRAAVGPAFAHFLVEQEIDSISLSPDSVLTATLAILETEQQTQETNRK